MAENVETALAGVELFAGVNGKVLKRLAGRGHVVQHEPGREVIAEGRDGVGFHLILEGEILIDVQGAHRPALGPGQYFGEISLLDGKPRSATATAGPAGASTWSLTSWQFEPLLDEHPELSRPLLRTLCARLRAAEATSAG